jgi:hypothetical protein
MRIPTRSTLVVATLATTLLAVILLAALPRCMRGAVEPETPVRSAALAGRQELAAHASAAPTQAADQVVAKAASTGSASTAPALAAALASRKLIRTAQLTVEVAQYQRAAEEVARLAESFGGYLAESQATRGPHDRQSGTVTIRVPAERFGAVLASLKGLGTVRSENVSTQDVSKAYADLETRLKVKRDTADRLRELLRTRTTDLQHVLQAERELARVTEEIEQMEGERRFFDAQVALSTIALTLHEPHALVEPGVFAPVGEALRDSAEVLSRSLAGLVYLAVFLTPWLVVAYGVWRIVRTVRGRRKVEAPAA